MKENLIKLLDEVAPRFQFDFIENTDRVANHLLKSEQVIVLPCKLGEKIYHLDLEIPEEEKYCSECSKNHSGFGDFYCDDNYIGWPSFEDKLSDPEDVCPRYKPVIREETFTLLFWATHEKYFGRTWFLTEEDANTAVSNYKGETT